jgi:RNA polymerase-binding transcription factor DksA
MSDLNQFEYNNEEEAEVAQILSLQYAAVGIQKIQEESAKRALQPSLEECETCGDTIPEGRRLAIKGCTTCIHCQALAERMKGYV